MNELINLINQSPELSEEWIAFAESLPWMDEPPQLEWDES